MIAWLSFMLFSGLVSKCLVMFVSIHGTGQYADYRDSL